MTDETNAPAGIAGLKPAAHAEWKAREKLMEELKASISQALPEDPLQRSIQAVRLAADLVGRLGDEVHDTYAIRHSVADALDLLAEALNDLPLGVVDTLLRPPEGVSSRLKTASERRQVRDAVTSTAGLKTAKGISADEARSRVARELGVRKSQIRSWQTPGRNPGLRK